MARWRSVPYDGPIWLHLRTPQPSIELLDVEQCSYREWKLFLLSLSWKMGKSRLDAFRLVEFGEEATTMQEMLVAGKAGNPMDYPCWMYILELAGQPIKGFMSAPNATEYKGCATYELAFGGLGWVFIAGREIECDTLRWFVLDRAGRMRLWRRNAGGGDVAHGRFAPNGDAAYLMQGASANSANIAGRNLV